MSATQVIQDNLRAMRLFTDFTSDEVANFIELADTVRVKAGEPIVRQDEPGDAMFIIVGGKATVSHHKGGKMITLAVLDAGDFFGEIALVDQGPRSADVVAVEDCTLLKIQESVIHALAGVYPGAAFKLLVAVGRVMVERMRRTNQKYIDSLLIGTQ